MFGIGRILKGWRLWRKLSPVIKQFEKLERSGELKAAFGSRKLRMVFGAQVMGTTVAGVMAALSFDDSTIKMVLDFLSYALFAGIGGNLVEHTADTIKTMRAAKASEAAVPSGGTP